MTTLEYCIPQREIGEGIIAYTGRCREAQRKHLQAIAKCPTQKRLFLQQIYGVDALV